ncbi:MAG TPA: sugar transferase [Bryobacteraceae bacterium]
MVRIFALLGFIALSPVLIVIACAIAIADGPPVLFRQTRIGLGGRPFELLKFRSMITNTPGPRVTAATDNRITRVGSVLRRFKLDELPQLWNIVRGEMCVIGPRPEVPHFVNCADPLWCTILASKPGLTSLATLTYRHEEEIVAQSDSPEQYYRDVLLPDKLRLDAGYLRSRTIISDTQLVFLTFLSSIAPALRKPERIQQIFASKACRQ